MEKFKSGVQLLKLSSKVPCQDSTCNTSVDDTVKFVYAGHTEAFMEISRGNCSTDPRGFLKI